MDSNSVPHFYFCCHYLYLTQQLCLLLQFVPVKYHWETSLVAQTVKRLPTVSEAQVQSLGREDLLEKEMATRFSIFAWKILWTEEPGRLQSMGSQSRTRGTSLSLSFTFWIPLKCLFTMSCLCTVQALKEVFFFSTLMNILASSQEPVIKSSVINKARNNHNLYGIFISVNSVQFSHSVMSNSLWPHGLRHGRPHCPSPTPGFYSNSCPLSRWCHPTIILSW